MSHVIVMVQHCHREEGALRLTRRCERERTSTPGVRSHAVDWAAASSLEAMRLLRSARNDKVVSCSRYVRVHMRYPKMDL